VRPSLKPFLLEEPRCCSDRYTGWVMKSGMCPCSSVLPLLPSEEEQGKQKEGQAGKHSLGGRRKTNRV